MSITIRPYVRGADEALRADIVNRAYGDRVDHVPLTVEDIKRWDESPQEGSRHRFIAELDGVPVGSGFASADPGQDQKKGFIDGPGVIPEQRRKGVGTALVRTFFDDLRQRGMERVEVQETDRPDINGFLATFGFKPVRSFSEMVRSLDSVPHDPGEPGRVELALAELTDANLAAIIDIKNEAFKEHYNHRQATIEQLRFMVRAVVEEGTVSHVLMAKLDGTPVGYLWYGYDQREIVQLKQKRGGLWDLGVLKPFRRRGVAGALLIAAMQHLKSDGMEKAWLYVDDMNLTSARRLYEHLGFTALHRDLVHGMELPNPGSTTTAIDRRPGLG